jgi:hypothetical protein
MSISLHCNNLIQRSSSFHPLYGDSLANQLPMALIALDRIGADRDCLDAFHGRYAARLRRMDAQAPARQGFVPSKGLGQRACFDVYLAHFRETLAQHDSSAVLDEWLPMLMPGVAASAFHPLIRLAYAIDADVEAELPIGLAYWAAEFQPLGPLGVQTSDSAAEIAEQLAPKAGALKGSAMVDRMREVAGLEAFRAGATQPAHLSLDDIRELCIDAYLRTGDSTLLHAVAATHAFRLAWPYQGDPASALRYHWQAILALLVSGGLADATEQRETDELPDWPACLARAMSTDDDYRIELTYTCWSEFNEYGDPRYLEAARRINMP